MRAREKTEDRREKTGDRREDGIGRRRGGASQVNGSAVFSAGMASFRFFMKFRIPRGLSASPTETCSMQLHVELVFTLFATGS
jgi:hypothetical protein